MAAGAVAEESAPKMSAVGSDWVMRKILAFLVTELLAI